MKKADPRLMLIMSMTVFGTLGLFVRNISVSSGELALYRAIGASTAHLKKLIGGEIACIVTAGLVAGLALGAVLYQLLLGVMLDSMAFPFIGLSVPAVMALGAGIVALFALISVLSVVWPLRQVGRLDPSLAMQQGDID